MKKLFQINKKFLNPDILTKLNLTAKKTYPISNKNFSSLFDEFKKEPSAIPDFKNLNSNFKLASKNTNPLFDNRNNNTNNFSKSKNKFSPSPKKNNKAEPNKKFEPITAHPEHYGDSEFPQDHSNIADKSYGNKNNKNNSKFSTSKEKNLYDTNSDNKSNTTPRYPRTPKLNIPFAKDGKPISIFTCKSTEHVIGMYYTYKTYFNKDLNLLAKVLIRFCQVANYEGMHGVENLAKPRIVKELIKNLSEKIDNDSTQNFENKVIIDIMKILRHNKVIEKVKERSYDMLNGKKVYLDDKSFYHKKSKKDLEADEENKEMETLIENFIVEKVLKNLNLKVFLKNLENGNQMTQFVQNLTSISKKTDLKRNFKFMLFKAEILSKYDKILIGKYQTRNLIMLLWALASARVSLPDAYLNITNELISRFEYLDFESKIQILFTSAIQKNFNKKLIVMIFNDFKNQIKLSNDRNTKTESNENAENIENNDYLMNKLLDSKLIYFKELMYFWNVWGQQNKKVDAVMSEEIFANIMKFIYFKYIKRRRNGDDLIFTEFDYENKTHKTVLLEPDRISMFGFLLRYAPDYGKNFDISELCFEDLYIKKRKERQERMINEEKNKEFYKDMDKENPIDGLKMDSEEEDDKIIKEINKKQDENYLEEKENQNEENQSNKSSNTGDIAEFKNEEGEEEIDKQTEKNIFYYQNVANKDRKYELDIQGVIEEFVNVFGYNLNSYVEYTGYDLISLAFADKSFQMGHLLNGIFKLMSTEHHKIYPREYVRICSLIPVFLKITKFNLQYTNNLISENSKTIKNNENNISNLSHVKTLEKAQKQFLSLLQKHEKNLINFLKGIISENNLSFFLHSNCDISVAMDIVEILDKIRIFDNQIFAKITNIASEEIKAYLDANKISALNFEQVFCLNYLTATLKVSLEKKISESLKKNFIEKFREEQGKSRFKPLKKTLLNSVLYIVDKQLRQLTDDAGGANKGNEKKEEKNKAQKKLEKDFDAELLKILNEEILFENPKNTNLHSDKEKNSPLNFDLELSKFVEFDSYENLRLPENMGIEERDIFFSLNAYDKLDTLLSSVKNLKYITNKTFEANYYLDYYLPKLKIGFLVYNGANSFEILENQKVLLFEDLPGQSYLSMKPLAFRPLIELFKSKFSMDLFVVNEKVLENKSDDIVAIIKKFNVSNS